METTIQIEHIKNVLSFIRKSRHELELQGVIPYHIKILMPKFYKVIIERYYETQNAFPNPHNTIEGLEIIHHYKNEIVVFDEMYYNTESHFRILNLCF